MWKDIQKAYRHSADNMRLLYVGSNTAEWHGLDRVLKGMADYQGNLKLELHIAGDAGYSIQRLVRTLRLRVTWFPTDIPPEKVSIRFLTSVTWQSEPWAYTGKTFPWLHTEGPGIHGRGIPFTISYTDDDLSPGLPYVFIAPPDESPIDMQESSSSLERYKFPWNRRIRKDADLCLRTHGLRVKARKR